MKTLRSPCFLKATPFSTDGKSAIGAEVELVRDHLAGERRAGGEVLPADVVVDVLVPAVVGQVLLQQLELADDEAAGGAVDGGVLRADGDADGLGGARG